MTYQTARKFWKQRYKQVVESELARILKNKVPKDKALPLAVAAATRWAERYMPTDEELKRGIERVDRSFRF